MSPEARRAVFLDRDGTLMDEVDHCRDPEDVRAIPGAREALEKLRSLGWLAVIITNQSGIGRGYFTVEQYEAVQEELRRQLGGQIDASYFCGDVPPNVTRRRKPDTGMIEEAVADFGINLQESWFIGDKAIDIECGRNAGCRTVLVRTGYGAKEGNTGADFVTDDVVQAIDTILAHTP